jgi:cytochrome c
MALLAAVLAACCAPNETERRAAALTGGDPARGRRALRTYGCNACHAIPGVPGGDAAAGPPLGGIAARPTIAAQLPNTPENMVRWIRHPQRLNPHTAMPDTGVSDDDAHHIAAYLYTLR